MSLTDKPLRERSQSQVSLLRDSIYKKAIGKAIEIRRGATLGVGGGGLEGARGSLLEC